CTDSAVDPACARMLDRAIEKHAACAAAISCSGLEPGPSSKRDLKVYPPLIVSPAVKVPAPVGRSPFHSALPLAGMSPSILGMSLEPSTSHEPIPAASACCAGVHAASRRNSRSVRD